MTPGQEIMRGYIVTDAAGEAWGWKGVPSIMSRQEAEEAVGELNAKLTRLDAADKAHRAVPVVLTVAEEQRA